MSHKASHWLATIPAQAISASAFRVLFHLCDAHNSQRDPESACFPSQEKLREASGLSNGGLNNALNALERANLIRRRRTRNADGTRGPTYYILGCDVDLTQVPSPPIGDGENAGQGCGPAVDKAVEGPMSISKFGLAPSPRSAPSHLHQRGDEPRIDPDKITSKIAGARERGSACGKTPLTSDGRAATAGDGTRAYLGLGRLDGVGSLDGCGAQGRESGPWKM